MNTTGLTPDQIEARANMWEDFLIQDPANPFDTAWMLPQDWNKE